MKYTVAWSRRAESMLASLWERAHDKRNLTEAADAIDKALRDSAHNLGESRQGDRRIYHVAPLGVMFQVSEQDRTVLVLDVWAYSKRSEQ